jgi:hypothetical protein
MSVEPATLPERPGEAGALARFLAKACDGAVAQPSAWAFVRALAVAGFVVFAAYTSIGWLHLNLTKPFKGERIDVRETFAVSAAEQDVALLRRWLPMTGKIGYLSEKPDLPRFETRMRLAPLLLDYDWRKYDVVLVDYPVTHDRALIDSPSYQLVTDLSQARSFARGMRIYLRKP